MKVVLDEGAMMPTRGHATDAGLDLYARESAIIPPGGSAVFDTGVHIELPRMTCGLLVSKSGLNVNCNITSTGLIDEGYTGSIRVKLYNHGDRNFLVRKGDKISQLVVLPCWYEKLYLVQSFGTVTERGEDGFGSTGR